MDEKTYRTTVIKMRAHADGWFRKHNQSDLIDARKLERVIDAENKRWLDEQKEVRPTVEPTQANLFTGDGNGKVDA